MSIRNPSERGCFSLCSSCFRCENKGRYGSCSTCTGRHDPEGKLDYADYRDDLCDCRNGILRWCTREGKMIIAKIPGNPYKGKVKGEAETADERDYNAQLALMRERLNDPHWDPVRFDQGQSTKEWYDKYRRGLT